MRPITALSLFTILPMPMQEIDRRSAAGALAALPLVGLVLGVVAGAVLWGAAVLGLTWLGAVAALAVLAGATGGLHLDGVADTADGLGSRKPAEQALDIMKRSDIGPMGVIALVLVLLAQLAAIVDAAAAGPQVAACALALAAATGRAGVLLISRGPSARPGGFGSMLSGAPAPGWVAANLLALAGLTAGCGWWLWGPVGALAWAAAWAGALLVGWCWARHVVRRLGGTTGDVFGSTIEITQLAVLAALAGAAQLL
nr:adenosylcobinamide-GDP ribazoletransferase [Tessaracoccus sp. OH4464_COT-324]